METIDNFNAMTDEQITALARELADKLYNDDSSYNSILWWCEEPKERKAKELKHTLRFLSERFCLVEKSVIKETWKEITDVYLEHSHITYDGARILFYDVLFPEIGKEEENEKKAEASYLLPPSTHLRARISPLQGSRRPFRAWDKSVYRSW
jgi:hypothetical protein